jgi:hypothetical protein
LSATSTDYMLHWRKWPIACSIISDLMFLGSHLQAWASIRDVRHERDPGNVGEPETVMIK